MEGIGRLKPGVSPEQANADLSAVLSQLGNEHPGDKGWRIFLVPLYREMVGRTQHMLLVLLGAVGLLLLIACVNAANLLLARSQSRQREIAVRGGAWRRRGRIVRQLLTESMLIALVGAALGTLLAVGGVHTLVALLPPGFPRCFLNPPGPLVFAFTLVIAVVTGILFGIVPRSGGFPHGSANVVFAKAVVVDRRPPSASAKKFNGCGRDRLACVLLIAAGTHAAQLCQLVAH